MKEIHLDPTATMGVLRDTRKKIKTNQSKTHLKETSRHAIVGAPAQPKQSSRKGKWAWRNNVGITTAEECLEELREEE